MSSRSATSQRVESKPRKVKTQAERYARMEAALLLQSNPLFRRLLKEEYTFAYMRARSRFAELSRLEVN